MLRMYDLNLTHNAAEFYVQVKTHAGEEVGILGFDVGSHMVIVNYMKLNHQRRVGDFFEICVEYLTTRYGLRLFLNVRFEDDAERIFYEKIWEPLVDNTCKSYLLSRSMFGPVSKSYASPKQVGTGYLEIGFMPAWVVHVDTKIIEDNDHYVLNTSDLRPDYEDVFQGPYVLNYSKTQLKFYERLRLPLSFQLKRLMSLLLNQPSEEISPFRPIQFGLCDLHKDTRPCALNFALTPHRVTYKQSGGNPVSVDVASGTLYLLNTHILHGAEGFEKGILSGWALSCSMHEPYDHVRKKLLPTS